jgi:GNAT superfamily N-acetyltransferase
VAASVPAVSDVTLRTARPADHPRVGEVVLAAYDSVGRLSEPYRAFLVEPDRWVPGTTATYVAEHAGEVIGAVGFVLPGDEEYEAFDPPVADAGFRFLAVHPEAQGLGAGGALVDRCVAEARARGARRIAIHTMEFMTTAHGLYLRRGFVRRPDLDVRFPSGVGLGFALDLTADAAEHFPPPGPTPDEPPWHEDVWAEVATEDATPGC